MVPDAEVIKVLVEILTDLELGDFEVFVPKLHVRSGWH